MFLISSSRSCFSSAKPLIPLSYQLCSNAEHNTSSSRAGQGQRLYGDGGVQAVVEQGGGQGDWALA